jgi:hypothetical protein
MLRRQHFLALAGMSHWSAFMAGFSREAKPSWIRRVASSWRMGAVRH